MPFTCPRPPAWPWLALLLLLAGCSAAMTPRPAPEGLSGLAAPPLETHSGPAAWLFFLAGLGLGAAGAWAGAAWRRRSLRRSLRGPGGKSLPGDLRRLRGALALLEDLLRDWRGRDGRSRPAPVRRKDAGDDPEL